MMIGDAGAPNTDASYAGETGDSVLTQQYYINKARQFQDVLNAVDATGAAVWETIGILDSTLTGAQSLPAPQTVSQPVYDVMGQQTGYEDVVTVAPSMEGLNEAQQVRQGLQNWLDDFEAKKFGFRTTAEAINAGTSAFNFAGGRFPVLAVPQGLGAAWVAPAIWAGSFAAAAVLITWGVEAIDSARTLLSRALALRAVAGDPEATRALTLQYAAADAAAAKAKASSGIFGLGGSLGTAVKWGAIGFLVWFAYRAYKER